MLACLHVCSLHAASSAWVMLLQGKLAARVHEPMATVEACRAAYEAAIAASDAEKVEAELCRHAADKHAKESGHQCRKAIRQQSKARVAASHSNQAEDLREAQQTHDNTLLALETRIEKATQAWEAAQTDELVNQLMSVLQSAERTHKV